VSDAIRIRDIEGEKARRRAARELVSEYHEEQLRLLLDRVRSTGRWPGQNAAA
jgi:hypothetical protein